MDNSNRRRNRCIGDGVYLVVQNTPRSFFKVVRAADYGFGNFGKAGNGVLSLSPKNPEYSGYGASSEDIKATLEWLLANDHTAIVRIEGVGFDGWTTFHFEEGDIELLLNGKHTPPASPAGLFVFVAYHHARMRECVLRKDVQAIEALGH